MDASTVLAALMACSCTYYAAACWALRRFHLRTGPPLGEPRAHESVSILKPAFGAGADFGALLRSHLQQDWPRIEVLVGGPADDERVRRVVEEVSKSHPQHDIRFVACPAAEAGANGKVQVLESLARRARHQILVVTDADIRLPERHLRTVCAELAEHGTGMVTCLYRAVPGESLASRLEAMRINAEFPAQVLLAGWIQGMRFALGSTLAVRAETLERAGGFAQLRGYIGDDYQLGKRVARLGLAVRVSSVPVATLPACREGWRRVWDRQLRWSRTIRRQRPLGHAGLVTTFATLWAGTGLLIAPATLWPLALATAGLRAAAGRYAASVVEAPTPWRDTWLLPLADLGACLLWIWSYLGSRVRWAGRTLRLGRDGAILSE